MSDKEQQKNSVFADVQPRVNIDELEREVLDFWERENIFAQSLEQTRDRELFTFYDGPPYATGKPHYGHILQSAIKDTVLRYKTMQGYHVPRRVGWDCHGLPVETLVEKELGFKTKKDIEAYGIEQFNQRCRETVFRYIDDFTATLKRMGRWADYEGAYATLDQSYMESEWWVFKQLWEQGLIYKDFKTTAYCTRCATPLSNFEVSMAYHDVTDTAVYVLLSVNPARQASPARLDTPLSLLIWTTTPWTLPGNTAVAINPELHYVTVEHEGKHIILAKERMEAVVGGEAKIVREWTADELQELVYEPLYELPVISNQSPASAKGSGEAQSVTSTPYRVVASEHVTAEDGTGLVHIATAFGEEDAAVGKRYGLPIFRTVGPDGHFLPDVPQWGGQHIFAANEQIVTDLTERGLLLKREQYRHSYPHCWRCDTPLIYYALDSWFVRVTELKERMLAINETIHWIPEHVQHGRFGKGIESAPDWAVSRSRFWSVPLPVWECDSCDERVCVGSVEELKNLSSVSEVPDMHRPYVDELTWPCQKCSGTMRRVPEVLDVWFDAGSMPYAQWHYPFENVEHTKQRFPADFIVEAIEQTRSWFYVMHVLAVALTRKDLAEKIGLGIDQPAYRNVIGSGLIFAEDGKKLSKKLKNYPEIEPTIATYGADALRFYLLSSASLGEPYRFSEKDLHQTQRSVYMTLWNVYSFFVRYANTHSWKPTQNAKFTTALGGPRSGGEGQNLLDQWIVARLQQVEHDVIVAADSYHVDVAARALIPYIDDLSNWYVRRSRQRFQRPENEAAMDEAFSTLYEVLVRTAKLLAPFMPFVAEAIYRNLTGQQSVHLELLPERPQLNADDQQLLSTMEDVRSIVAEALAVRAKSGIKVRQPLGWLHIVTDQPQKFTPAMIEIITDEVNVTEVQLNRDLPEGENVVRSSPESRIHIALDLTLTDELRNKGWARELVRHGQQLRRQANYALDDRIRLVLTGDSARLNAVLDQERDYITFMLQVDEILRESTSEDVGADITIEGESLHIGVVK